jgi:hypothetical protein
VFKTRSRFGKNIGGPLVRRCASARVIPTSVILLAVPDSVSEGFFGTDPGAGSRSITAGALNIVAWFMGRSAMRATGARMGLDGGGGRSEDPDI